MAGRHLVARQLVEISAGDRMAAQQLADRTSRMAPTLQAALERLFDRHDRGGERLRLDRIEIDIGHCDTDRWEDAFIAGLERALPAKLAAALDTALPPDPGPAPDPLLLLATFARTGRLPWWNGPADTPGAAVQRLAQTGAEPEAIRRILALPGAIDRLIFQLGDAELAIVAALAAGGEARPLEAIGQRAPAVQADAALPPLSRGTDRRAISPGSPGARLEAWRARLAAATQGLDPSELRQPTPVAPSSIPPAPAPVARLSKAAPRQPPSAALPVAARSPAGGHGEADLPAARLLAIAARSPALATVAGDVASQVERLDAAARAALFAGMAAADDDTGAIATAIQALLAAGAISQSRARAWRNAIAGALMPGRSAPASHAPDEDPHDAAAIDCAGLAMLAPFLPRYFEVAGLVADSAFSDVPSQHRAATLLGHLASGERQIAEDRLLLPKLLTGLDADAVHVPGDPVSDAEAEDAGTLLKAVIGHAPVLGRISIEGLRSAFLQRPGLVSIRDGHWLLRVKRQGHDVLLDRLPWGFGWVKLPWMAMPLQVEW